MALVISDIGAALGLWASDGVQSARWPTPDRNSPYVVDQGPAFRPQLLLSFPLSTRGFGLIRFVG
jgi:hypothetical protein